MGCARRSQLATAHHTSASSSRTSQVMLWEPGYNSNVFGFLNFWITTKNKRPFINWDIFAYLEKQFPLVQAGRSLICQQFLGQDCWNGAELLWICFCKMFFCVKWNLLNCVRGWNRLCIHRWYYTHLRVHQQPVKRQRYWKIDPNWFRSYCCYSSSIYLPEKLY